MRGLAALTLVLGVAIAYGCSSDDGAAPTPPVVLTTSSGSGSNGQGGGGGAGGGSAGSTAEGGQTPVYLGLSANPLAPEGASEKVLAELTVLAAGVRAMHLALPFAPLGDGELADLATRVDDYDARGLRVVITVLIADGAAVTRPPGTEGLAWDDPITEAALTSLLDSVLGATGDKIDVVIFSRALDAYLAEEPAEAEALTALGAAAIDHLHAERPLVLGGVGLRYVPEPDASYLALAALGDVVALSYLPGLGDDMIPAGVSAAHDLDAMIELAGERPIVLQAVGFPSAPAINSSPELQAQQLEALMTALEPRRAAIPILNFHQLHDLDPAQCDALVAAQGLATGPYGDYACTTGLRDTTGAPKPAWETFIQAAARFAGP